MKSFFQAETCVPVFTTNTFLELGYNLLEIDKNENTDTTYSVVMRLCLKNKWEVLLHYILGS